MRSYSPTVTPAGTSIWISTFAVAMGSSVNQEIGCFQLHPTLCRHRLAAKGQNAQRCTYQRESHRDLVWAGNVIRQSHRSEDYPGRAVDAQSRRKAARAERDSFTIDV